MNAAKRKRTLLTTVLRKSNADILRFLHRRVGAEDAPDLFGETLLIAWRRVDDLPADPDEVRMWLFGLARHAAKSQSRGTTSMCVGRQDAGTHASRAGRTGRG